MKRSTLVRGITAGFFLAAAVSAPAAAFAPTATPARAPADSARTLGVVPFQVDETDSLLVPLSFALPDLLTTDLSRSKQLTMVERARIGLVLRELDLAKSGSLATANAPRIGKLVRAQRLVTGSLRRSDAQTIIFDAHVIDAQTGAVLQTLNASAPVDDILAAEKQVALRLFDYLGVILTPQELALVNQRPTQNIAALVAYGHGAKAEVNAQYALAVRSFHQAALLDKSFSAANTREQSVRAQSPNSALAARVNDVNRPLDGIPTTLVPGLATDPAFPASRVTILVNIVRP